MGAAEPLRRDEKKSEPDEHAVSATRETVGRLPLSEQATELVRWRRYTALLQGELRASTLCALAGSCAAISLSSQASALPSFAEWALAHNRVYANASEAATRAAIYERNVAFAFTHNAQGTSSYSLGATTFADFSSDEWKAFLRRPPPAAPVLPAPSSPLDATSYPPAKDWAASGCLGPVRDQGQCGADWALAAVACLEAACCLSRGGGEANATRLSVQEVLDCGSGAQGCSGGLASDAWKYAQGAGGLCTAAAYPYTGRVEACAASHCPHSCRPSSVVAVTPNAPAALLTALAGRPIVLGVDAGSNAFMLYTGGVISGPACGTQVDHVVLATGYDTAATPTPFVRVANSWGAGWGEGGYARIALSTAAGPGTCGIYTDASYVTVEKGREAA